MAEHENPQGSGLTSGTASDALLRAVEAASSADTQPEGNTTGDTTAGTGEGTHGPTPAATGQTQQPNPAAATSAPDGTPEHRIQAAVRNAREQTTREVESRYAAFKGMDPEQAQTGLQLLQEIQSDPRAFLEELSRRLGVAPTQAAPAVEEDDEEFPKPDLVSKDGQYRTYSDSSLQKMLDIHGRRVAAALRKEMAPIVSHVQTAQTREKETADFNRRAEAVRGALEEVKAFPHYNEAGVLEALGRIPEQDRRAMGPIASLHKAYNLFIQEKVFPTIDTDAERRVRESFTRKAATSTGSVHPSGQGGETKAPQLRGVDDLASHMERLAAAQG